jgi:hypothetical protein
MKMLGFALSILLCASAFSTVEAYDSNLDQKVKYNQQRTKWKIKEGRQSIEDSRKRMNESRSGSSGVSNYGTSGVSTYGTSGASTGGGSSYSSSSSKSSSSSSSSTQDSRKPSVSASSSLNTFMKAANLATNLDQLHPYAIKTTREHWGRLDPTMKQNTLMGLKKWTYHARVEGEECQPMVATVKLGGQNEVKGANLWVENGVWKFSNIIKK